MMPDFDEHLHHRRIMQEAFARSRLAGCVEHIDRVASDVVADWPRDDPRFLLYPAMKKLALDIASMVFMGHEPGADKPLATAGGRRALTVTTRAGGAIVRYPVPPFKWWRVLRERKVLEDYFIERLEERRDANGSGLLSVLCHRTATDSPMRTSSTT